MSLPKAVKNSFQSSNSFSKSYRDKMSNKPHPLARGKVFNSKSHYIVLDASSGQLLRDEERGATSPAILKEGI
jgi:hypothetical protein